MDPEDFGNVGRNDQHQKNKGDQRFADRLLFVIKLPDLAQERLDQVEHEQNIQRRQHDGEKRAGHAAGPGHGDHRRQQAPCRHVVVGGAGDRQHPHRRLAQIPLLNDPRQHRKRRNADRDGHEQRERHERSVPRPELRIDHIGEPHSHQERHDDAGVADDQRFAGFAADDAQVKLHPDYERAPSRSG